MNPLFRLRPARRQRGFLLLEIMLATIIFTLGVLSLGRCLSACMAAQQASTQEARARMALENYMFILQAKPSLPDETKREELKGMFKGMTMTQRRRTLNLKNEDNVSMGDLHEITLTVEWTGPGRQPRTRTIAFDLLRGSG